MSKGNNKISFYWGVPGILLQIIGAHYLLQIIGDHSNYAKYANLPNSRLPVDPWLIYFNLTIFITGTFLLLIGIISYIKYHIFYALITFFFLITYLGFFSEAVILGILNILGYHKLAAVLWSNYGFSSICDILSIPSLIYLLYLSTFNKAAIQKNHIKTKTGIIISIVCMTLGTITFSILYSCGHTFLGKPFWGTIQNSVIEMSTYFLLCPVQSVILILGVRIFNRMERWRIFPILTIIVSGTNLSMLPYGVY